MVQDTPGSHMARKAVRGFCSTWEPERSQSHSSDFAIAVFRSALPRYLLDNVGGSNIVETPTCYTRNQIRVCLYCNRSIGWLSLDDWASLGR